MAKLGVIAIGRNEGERLLLCLRSALASGAALVYVDSGSTDGSPGAAADLGASVVNLDLSVPFTAARARNAGFEALSSAHPDLAYVQFVDGDCEIAPAWLELAKETLKAGKDLAVVCGRRRERYPEASVYNRLCDMEWNTPIGEATSCGGDALIRASAFRQVGGYDPTLIAGEEPEMCVRLRHAGWRIQRLDAEMTLHDAAMTRFSQWWRRAVRSGHAYAEGAAKHGGPPERFCLREARSIWVWGLAIPAFALILALPSWGLSLAGWILAELHLARKVARFMISRGFPESDARTYGAFVALGKIPQAIGQIRYWAGRASGRRSRVIEYK
jgi:glycosyltransferase involved in cell wall biosynthesis